MPSPDPLAVAAHVLELLDARSSDSSPIRLVCIDGPSGSGKSTLADALHGLTHAPVIRMDDMYPGWDGLAHASDQLEDLLRPLAAGKTGSYRHFDWVEDRFTHTVQVPPAPLLIVEGVGSGSASIADLITVLVWVEAERDLRMRRGIERDGEAYAPHWERWADQEVRHFGADGTRGRADLVVTTD